MNVLGVIPARWASERFPGKPLALLFDKPLIQWVYEQGLKCECIDELIVATDDERIAKTVQAFGGKFQMTNPDHQTGTDRMIETISDRDCEFVINLQGDEPLISPRAVDQCIHALKENTDLKVSSLITRIQNKEELEDPNVVKVVSDHQGFALYFSRSLIPYPRHQDGALKKSIFFKHLGVYCFRRDYLMKFGALAQSELELIEKLEQLRILQSGEKIFLVESDIDSVGIDTPKDIEKVEEMIKNRKQGESNS